MIPKSVYTLREVAIVTLYFFCGRIECASENAREFQVLATLFNGALNEVQSILHNSAGKKDDPPKFNALSILDDLLTTTEDSDENHTKAGTSEWRKEFPHISSRAARQGLSNILKRIKKRIEVLQGDFDEQERLRQRARNETAKLFLEAAIGVKATTRLLQTIENSGVTDTCSLEAADVTAGSGYDTICKGDGSSEAGQAIVFEFACICAKKNTGNSDNYCGTDITGVASDDTNSAARVAARATFLYQKARASGYKSAILDTSEALLAKLAEFHGLLGTNVHLTASDGGDDLPDRPFILGFANGYNAVPVCDGAAPTHNGAAHGVCVSYKKLFTKGDKIPWVDKLEQAAKKLQAVQAEHQKLLKIENEIRTLVRNAQSAYDQVALNTVELSTQQIHQKAEQNLSKANSIATNNPSLTAENAAPSTTGFVFYRGLALNTFLV